MTDTTPDISTLLRTVPAFAGYDDARLAELAPAFALCRFAEHELLLHQGETAEEVFVVLDGTVRIELPDAQGRVTVVAEFGSGELVGERAVLVGEARSVDVRARSAVTALRLARHDFLQLVAAGSPLSTALCRDLARQLGSWPTRQRHEEEANRAALADVVSWQLLPEFAAFPGHTPWVRDLNRQLVALGQSAAHVLILGERGTWKDLAARLIHHHAPAQRPVFFLDCAAPPPLADAAAPGMAQQVALFGHAALATPGGTRERRGLLELANGGDLILRNVEALTLPVQRELAAALEQGHFRRRGDSAPRPLRLRLIATSCAPLDELTRGGTFLPTLLSRLAQQQVTMLPLRERKKDLPVIARQLLRTLSPKHGKAVTAIAPEALNALLDHDWPLNGSELYQVMQRAVLVAPGTTIGVEHIFLPGHGLEEGRFNLLELPALERLLRHPTGPAALRRVSVPLFLTLLAATLCGPPTANAANLALWTVWWPLLLLAAFVTARSWCSYCPLAALSEAVGRGRALLPEGPQPLRRWGSGLSLTAMALILLIEQGGGLVDQPRATGWLLLLLLLATLGCDLLLGRRIWCKFLCPLGRIVALIGRVALIEMRSNAKVCLGRCRADDCVKEKGCPMGIHPTGLDHSDHCILCLACLRHCPHRAMHLDLRNPLQGLFGRQRRRLAEAAGVVLLAGVVAATKGVALVAATTPWSAPEFAAALTLAGSYLLLVALAALGGGWQRWPATFSLCGLAYLPLAGSALFAVYLRLLAERGGAIPPLLLQNLGLDQLVDPSLLTPELGTLRLLIPLLLGGGAALAWSVLGRMSRHYALDRWTVRLQRTLLAATTALYLYLL